MAKNQDLVNVKKADVEAATNLQDHWYSKTFSNPQACVDYLNTTILTPPGTVTIVGEADGSVTAFIYVHY